MEQLAQSYARCSTIEDGSQGMGALQDTSVSNKAGSLGRPVGPGHDFTLETLLGLQPV